jgi:hypothetical protein
VAPSRICQCKLVQAVSERHALSPRRVFLSKVDLTLSAELGTPPTSPPFSVASDFGSQFSTQIARTKSPIWGMRGIGSYAAIDTFKTRH